jgi:DNA polymerase zeta
MRLDAEYYIKKGIIPALDRIFSLVGANVRTWYDDMPKPMGESRAQGGGVSTNTMDSFVRSRICPMCRLRETDQGTTEVS